MVPCHAIYVGHDSDNTHPPEGEAAWLIQPFQRGETPVFLDHIRTAIELWLQAGSGAHLVFSGGATRPETRQTEARSYLAAALAQGWLHCRGDVEKATAFAIELQTQTRLLVPCHDQPDRIPSSAYRHILLEEFARDSLENLAYSVAVYQKLHAGALPSRIIIVGWGFKEPRFRAHLIALGLDDIPLEYCGVGEPADPSSALAGERQTTAAFRADPLGNHSPLIDKRRKRNPHNMLRSYTSLDSGLLDRIVW